MADLIGLADKLDEEEIQFVEGHAKIDLRASEIDLIRLLFEPERNRIFDAATVTSRIDAISQCAGCGSIRKRSTAALLMWA